MTDGDWAALALPDWRRSKTLMPICGPHCAGTSALTPGRGTGWNVPRASTSTR